MIPIRELLNKIKWDKRENPKDYAVFYYDRVEDLLKEIKYEDIKRIDSGFLIIELAGKDVNIPLHRIKKVKKKGGVVWER